MNTTSELTPGLINAATGRELDWLVAEQVMGFSERKTAWEGEWATWPDGNTVRHFSNVPAYSTDGNAMLGVLGQMKAFEWAWDIGTLEDQWWVECATPITAAHGGQFTCHSLPKAVCRAALLAVLAQKEAGR